MLYVSPLKALATDVERNLRSPLVGIRQAAQRLGATLPDVTVGIRTGDTPPNERRAFATKPPDILITTPESLYLVLTSGARAGLAGVRTVIVDEIHAVAATKRGAHLALSLERLDALLDRPGGPGPAQRIGLSATVQPVEAVAEYLGGARTRQDGGREVVVVQPPSTKQIVVDVVVPVPDLADLRAAGTQPDDDLSGAADAPLVRPSIWPHVEERVVDLVAAHRSTLVFTNSRRGAERLTARMNEVWAQRPRRGRPGPRRGERGVRARPVRHGGRRRHARRGDDPGPRAPRLDEPGRADPDRVRAQGGQPAGGRRDELARAGHRHGRDRPRRAGRARRRRWPAGCSASVVPGTRSVPCRGASCSRRSAASSSRRP